MQKEKLFNTNQKIYLDKQRVIEDHHKYSGTTNLVGYNYKQSPNCVDSGNIIKDCSL